MKHRLRTQKSFKPIRKELLNAENGISKEIQGKWHQALSPSDTINIVLAFLAFLSFVVSVVNICEMRAERSLAYRPSVLVNPTTYEFSWNSEGFEDWVRSSESMDTPDGGSFTIPVSVFTNGSFSKFAIANIGVGTAKNLSFSWHESNTDKLIKHLISLDKTKEDFCLVNQSIVFDYGDHIVAMDKDIPTAFMYLLPNASEQQPLDIPPHYTLLMNEIVKTGKYQNDLIIFLYIEYDDIQGKHYKDAIAIRLKKTFYIQETDGSGSAKYQLVPQILNI